MAKAQYIVELTTEEREQIKQLISKGRVAAYKQLHARILLLADEGTDGGKKMSNTAIAQALNCGKATVERICKRFVMEGFVAALGRKNRTNYQYKLDGKDEAHLVTLACSKPPKGHKNWTLRLLADEMVELRFADSLSYQTVRRTLKKTNLSLG